LITTLIDDGYPSSHPVNKTLDDPYEIEQYFDYVERTKAAAILRMIEYEVGDAAFINAIIVRID
jgi:aminopeptidase N